MGGYAAVSARGRRRLDPGSYDPDLGLFYIGTAQAKPWVAASRGMTTRQDALYTNSTLALNSRTGQVQWYFQHAPGETLDLDIVYERVLVDADDEQWLFTIGKDGILSEPLAKLLGSRLGSVLRFSGVNTHCSGFRLRVLVLKDRRQARRRKPRGSTCFPPSVGTPVGD